MRRVLRYELESVRPMLYDFGKCITMSAVRVGQHCSTTYRHKTGIL
jgi:hypothetical protein